MATSVRLYDQKRVWIVGGVVLAVVIALVGWFVAVSPELDDARSTRDQVSSVELQNSVLAAKNAALKAQNGDGTTLRDSLAAALAALPADSGLSAFTRQLSEQAAAHNVSLTAVNIGDPAPLAGGAVASSAAPVPGTETGAETGTTATNDSSESLVAITVRLTATGLGKDLSAFLYDVQVTGPRRALVTDMQLVPTAGSDGNAPDAVSDLDLGLTVFTAPMTADEQAALQKLLSGS